MKQPSAEEQKNQEWVDILLDAQEKMNEAIEMIEMYVRESGDGHTEAYILAHLKIMASGDHGYLSSGANLDQVIEQLQYSEEELDERYK